MKKLVILIVILGLGFLLLRQCSISKDLKNELNLRDLKTDTIYVSKEIKVPEPYNVYLPSEKVYIYKTDTIKVKYNEIRLIDNYVRLYLPNNKDSLDISKWFIMQYPNNNKLIDLDLKRKSLYIDLLTTKGLTVREIYKLDLDKYNYRYVNNQMSYKRVKKLTIEPSIEYTYRPFNNLHDLKTGLDFKTTRFNYELGLGTFYYPKFDDQLKFDVLVSIKYKF